MNLEDLKNNWNEEIIEDIPEVSLNEQKELNQPLAKIRKNLKMELWTSLFFIVMLMLFLAVSIDTMKLLFYSEGLMLVTLIVCGFYFMKFKRFYSEIENPNYSTFQSVLELNYRLKYFTDLYTSYYISFIPFMFCQFLLIFEMGEDFSEIKTMSSIPVFIGSLLLGLLILYFTGKMSFSVYYGRYIAKVADLLKEIKHPYENFETEIIKVSKRKYWYSKTEDYLEGKLGVFGKVINLLLWLIILTLICIVVGLVLGFIIGFGIGYFSAK